MQVHYTYYQPISTDPERRGVHILIPRVEAPQDYTYLAVHEGDIEVGDHPVEALEQLWAEHNAPDRPRGPEIRSMCMGDIVDLEELGLWIAAQVGWRKMNELETPELVSTSPPGVDYPVRPSSPHR